MANNTNTTVRPHTHVVQEAILTAEHHKRRNHDNLRLRSFYLGQLKAHCDTYEMLTGVPAFDLMCAVGKLSDEIVGSLCWLPSLNDPAV